MWLEEKKSVFDVFYFSNASKWKRRCEARFIKEDKMRQIVLSWSLKLEHHSWDWKNSFSSRKIANFSDVKSIVTEIWLNRFFYVEKVSSAIESSYLNVINESLSVLTQNQSIWIESLVSFSCDITDNFSPLLQPPNFLKSLKSRTFIA